jgi:hypothetical protein
MWSEWALYTFINKLAYKGFYRWAEPIIHVTRGSEANIQGGSDISGTLSKLHCHIKKLYLKKLFRPEPSQLSVEA